MKNHSHRLGSLLPKYWSDRISPQVNNDQAFQQFLLLWSDVQELNGNESFGLNLFAGYYFQKVASYLPGKEKEYLEFSLEYYSAYLKNRNLDKDAKYFVLWQMAIIQDQLDYDWNDVEIILLKANKISPTRAEAMMHIIAHYVALKNWKNAYKFSLRARNKFHGKHPSNSVWFPDPELYTWKILNLHAAICFHIGNVKEAENTLKDLKLCMG